MLRVCGNLVLETLKNVSLNGNSQRRRIKWISLDEAIKKGKVEQQPIMVFVHLTGCSACIKFRPQLESSDEIIEISKDFLMVEIEEPKANAELRSDGHYTPRVMFLDPNGQFVPQFYNRLGNPSVKFYYPNAWTLLKTMQEVLITYPPKCSPDKPCTRHVHMQRTLNVAEIKAAIGIKL